MLRFSDGVTFDTSGPLRIESRHDGLYVVGQGMLIPIESREEGRAIISKHSSKPSGDERVVDCPECGERWSYLENVVDCPHCGERWCTKCEMHWAECPCPGPHEESE